MQSATAISGSRIFAANRARGRVGLDGRSRRRRHRGAGACTKAARCGCGFPAAASGELEAVTGQHRRRHGRRRRLRARRLGRRAGPSRRDHGRRREDLSQPRTRRRPSMCKISVAAGGASPGCRRKRSCSTVPCCSGASRSISPATRACSWSSRGLRPAPAWAKACRTANCTTAGACGGTARLIYADGMRLSGGVAATLGETAVANGGVARRDGAGRSGRRSHGDAVHAMSGEFRGEVGVSAWNGRAVVRFCARDGAALAPRHHACAREHFGRRHCRALWIN